MYNMYVEGAVRVQSKDQRKLMGELRCGCAKLEVEMGDGEEKSGKIESVCYVRKR